MNSHAGPRHAAAGDAADDFDRPDDFDRLDDFDRPDAATDNNERGQVVGALLWVARVIGLALLWYGIGYASTLAPENLAGAPQGNALPPAPLSARLRTASRRRSGRRYGRRTGRTAGEPGVAGRAWWPRRRPGS